MDVERVDQTESLRNLLWEMRRGELETLFILGGNSARRWFFAGAAAMASAGLLLWTKLRPRRRSQAPTMAPFGDANLAPEERPEPLPTERVVYLEPEEVHRPDGRIEHPAVRREPRDVRLRLILAILVGAALVGGGASVGVWKFLMLEQRPRVGEPSPYAPPPLTSELPRPPRLDPLMTEQPEKREAVPYGAQAVARLRNYGPTEDADFGHIPIEKAIELAAGTLPVRRAPVAQTVKDNGLLDGGEPNSGRLFRNPPKWITEVALHEEEDGRESEPPQGKLAQLPENAEELKKELETSDEQLTELVEWILQLLKIFPDQELRSEERQEQPLSKKKPGSTAEAAIRAPKPPM